MSSNSSLGRAHCPVPFLQADQFPSTGGFIEGRFCSAELGTECCLPCPHTDWLYPESFKAMTDAASWINIPGTICSVFLVLSFAILPVSKTHRHYLSMCLVISVAMMNLGFLIPLGAKPEQCYNQITPNDMRSSTPCAISGAFVIAGGWFGVMWVFLMTLALHLQICWHLVMGKNFMWCTMAAGWGIPTAGVTTALILSDVSFRFGKTCHVNAKNSLGTLWAPLLVVAGLTLLTQLGTFGYCLKVYLASLGDDDSVVTSSSGVRSFYNSDRGILTPKHAYRRIRKVIQLQWRGITIVMIIIADVIFFAIVFVALNDVESSIIQNTSTALPWFRCLVANNGDKNTCLGETVKLRVNEATVMSVVVLLSLNGFWCLLLLGRISMLTGWYELISGKNRSKDEFVSADVLTLKEPYIEPTDTYEMRSSVRNSSRTLEPLCFPPNIAPVPMTADLGDGRETPNYFGKEALYSSPPRAQYNLRVPQRPEYCWDSETAQPRRYPSHYIDPLSMNKI